MSALAGCLGGSSDSPEGVVETFYQSMEDDPDEDEINDLFHSQSLVDIDPEGQQEETPEIERIETDIEDEDLDEADLEEETMGMVEDIEPIAESDNAIVEAIVETDEMGEEVRHVVAVEDDEWRIVI